MTEGFLGLSKELADGIRVGHIRGDHESSRIPSGLPPSSACRSSCLRPASTTLHPSRRNASAVALPIPVPAPVTIAVFMTPILSCYPFRYKFQRMI